jgi:hypothetical protein
VAAWFIHIGICQCWLGLYIVEYCQWRIGLHTAGCLTVAACFIHFIYSGIYTSGGLVYTVEYLPVAAWYINSGISASGGLVYTQRNISQRRLGLCIVEYLPVAAWFIQLNICQ